MVRAQTFKRARVIAALARIKAKMEEAKKESEGYARAGSNPNADPSMNQFYKEMFEVYRMKYMTLQSAVEDLMHDFGVMGEELEAKKEDS